MKQSELCNALELSKAQVSKLVARGMPTTSVEEAEEWRRRNLEPMMRLSHQARKDRPVSAHATADTPPRNPIDAVVFGVLPQLLFDRPALLAALCDAGFDPDPEQFEALAAGLAAHLWRVLTEGMGLPKQPLNLPSWLDEAP